MQLSKMLAEQGMTSGMVYATGILKGHEAARRVADFKAQETIHADHDRIIAETARDSVMCKVRDIETVCDADFRAIVESDRYLLKLLNSVTIEWAQQTYNRSVWEPSSWPGE